MGEALARAVARRAQAARWLLGERLPDWDFALVVVSEPHSAIEGLWHGVDPAHPLHQMPSAGPAHEGLLAVYRGVDRLVGDLAAAFPDAALVVFSMGGMGPNHSDTASMVLLPELMYRHAFDRSLLRQPDAWTRTANVPSLGHRQDWAAAIHATFPDTLPGARPFRTGLEKVLRRFVPQSWIGRLLSAALGRLDSRDALPVPLALDARLRPAVFLRWANPHQSLGKRKRRAGPRFEIQSGVRRDRSALWSLAATRRLATKSSSTSSVWRAATPSRSVRLSRT